MSTNVLRIFITFPFTIGFYCDNAKHRVIIEICDNLFQKPQPELIIYQKFLLAQDAVCSCSVIGFLFSLEHAC